MNTGKGSISNTIHFLTKLLIADTNVNDEYIRHLFDFIYFIMNENIMNSTGICCPTFDQDEQK